MMSGSGPVIGEAAWYVYTPVAGLNERGSGSESAAPMNHEAIAPTTVLGPVGHRTRLPSEAVMMRFTFSATVSAENVASTARILNWPDARGISANALAEKSVFNRRRSCAGIMVTSLSCSCVYFKRASTSETVFATPFSLHARSRKVEDLFPEFITGIRGRS